MIFLCLDQSTKITGYSVWKKKKLCSHGIIDLSDNKDLDSRMTEMYIAIDKLIKDVKPDFVIIEDTQFQSNQKVYQTLSKMQGMIFASTIENRCGIYIVAPNVWKSYIGLKSRKRAEQKAETFKIIQDTYHIEPKTDDESDSIAIGMWSVNNLKTEGD